MEEYFAKFKEKTIGDEIYTQFNKYGNKAIYADWAASGRLYLDIENEIISKYAPLICLLL